MDAGEDYAPIYCFRSGISRANLELELDHIYLLGWRYNNQVQV